MNIGYARVSTLDQNLQMQTDALKASGCEMILQEKVSGKSKDRPELAKLFKILREGDTLIVWKLDRLGRSLRDLIELMTKLKEMGVTFKSLNDSIDTSTATGRFTFNIFASLAEFEREMIRERTMSGLSAARARGRLGGRPKGLSKKNLNIALSIKVLYDQKQKSMEEIAQMFGKSRTTCYRYLEVANEMANK